MWRHILLLGLVGLVLPAYGESLRVSGLAFKKLLVVGPVEVKIERGGESELVVRGDSDDLEKQPFFLDGDVLVVGRSRTHRGEEFRNLKFRLTAESLKQLKVQGSGEVYVEPLDVRDFLASVEGSGDLKMFGLQGESVGMAVEGSGEIQIVKLSAKSLKLVCSGSGDIAVGRLVGEDVDVSVRGSGDIVVSEPSDLDTVEINLVGSGDVDLHAVNAQQAVINVMGSGDASIGEVQELEVNIIGSGDVKYRGEPDHLERTILGSGELHRLD